MRFNEEKSYCISVLILLLMFLDKSSKHYFLKGGRGSGFYFMEIQLTHFLCRQKGLEFYACANRDYSFIHTIDKCLYLVLVVNFHYFHNFQAISLTFGHNKVGSKFADQSTFLEKVTLPG